MVREQTLSDIHINKITKKYIIDLLNILLFSKTVLWDGIDQFNELPIFRSTNDSGIRTEQRGGLLINKAVNKALRVLVSVIETPIQRVCYRITSLKNTVRIDESKRLFYPFDAFAIDLSVANLNLGMKDITSYSFSDNTNNDKNTTNSRLFSLVNHITNSVFVSLEDEALFKDMLDDVSSLPPMPDEPHYKLVFGVYDGEGCKE